MTVSEIAQVTGKSRDIVLKAIHDLLPRKEIVPKKKIVLFSYFRATLEYLFERLSENNLRCIVLVGGNKTDKDDIIRKFKEEENLNILLSSEIGSEGIDLQFSDVLINYDLPWNPMRVEQRIGRLDRLGQKAEKIIIWNLFYDDTIDSQIYKRLYARLNIFEKSLALPF